MQSHFDLLNFEFNQNYSMKAIGTFMFALIGPGLLESLGFRKTYMFYLFLTFLGQAFEALGIYTHIWELLLSGRIIFSGAEIVLSLQIPLFLRWFDSSQIPQISSFVYIFTRVMKIVSSVLDPYLVQSFGIMVPFVV